MQISVNKIIGEQFVYFVPASARCADPDNPNSEYRASISTRGYDLSPMRRDQWAVYENRPYGQIYLYADEKTEKTPYYCCNRFIGLVID